MKIAIPTSGDKLCMHFGHCEVFTIMDVDEDEKQIIATDQLVPPPHEPGMLPRWLREQGADMVIAGGMGSRAQGLFVEAGMKVIVGAKPDSPEAIAQSWMQGTLETGVNTCDH